MNKMNKMKIKLWFFRNQSKIAWFIIGWLVTSGIRELFMGQFISAGISFLFAYLNYILSND